jgi:hypothetical protein
MNENELPWSVYSGAPRDADGAPRRKKPDMRIAVPVFLGLVACAFCATGIFYSWTIAPPAVIEPIEQPWAVPSSVEQKAQTEQAPYGAALPPSDAIRVKTETIRRPEDNADDAMGQQVIAPQTAAPSKAKRHKKKTARIKKRATQTPQ